MDDDLTRLPESHSPTEALLENDSYFGPYRIVGLLGRGGMGEVYEAEHRDLHTRHALKLINPEIVGRSDAKERFKREARVMARLRHPHIVHVDDFGELDGRIWLRMDLMDGWGYQGKTYHSLQDLMREKGALPESLVRRLLGEILDGLGFAHDAGVVHRDLKPANLLFDEEGRVKITDFGLVSLAGADWLQSQVQLTVARSMADPDATRLEMEGSSAGTSTQALLGTYAYMSPEQKKGSEVDARSDLYAVGLIGFQLLTGEETPGFEMPSDLVQDLDPGWDDWVKLALASRVDRRFSDAKTMKESLLGYNKSHHSATEAPPPLPANLDKDFAALEQRVEEKMPSQVPDDKNVDQSNSEKFQGEVEAPGRPDSATANVSTAKISSKKGVGFKLFSSVFIVIIIAVLANGFPMFQKIRETSIEKAVINNLRQLAAGSDMYFLEEGLSSVPNMDTIVGPESYVKEIDSVGGEDYRELFPIRTSMQELSVFVPDLERSLSIPF